VTAERLRPLLRWGSVALLAALLSLILYIAAGWGDPRPLGERRRVSRPAALALPAADDSLEREVRWLETAVSPPATLRLTTRHQSGERDVGYGLALGEGDAYLAAAVSPLGYVAIWETIPGEADRFLLPWQPWPHVAPVENEIWVDLLPGGEMRVWLNREWLWRGTAVPPGPNIGLVGESYGDAATVAFPRLDRYTD
jgi:hypothetical protein